MTNKHRGFAVVVRIFRILLGVLGGYGLAYGVVALMTVLLALAMPRGEAFVLAAMLGFLIYLVILVWAFAEKNLVRLIIVMPLGAIGTYGLAHTLGG